MAWYSQTWNFLDGAWVEGNPPMIGPRSHAAWLASTVFDGARVFEGTAPDIERHAARVNRSAATIGLDPTQDPDAIVGLIREGAKRFTPGTALYVRPMYWGEIEGPGSIVPDPAGARFCLCLYEAPMPSVPGFTITRSPFRRPTLESAPTDAKAGCLYPNNARVIREARARGFDNALVCDALGNVAETGSSNIFMARDGAVFTPVPNGTFLNGITRQRVIALLRADGVEVVETTLTYTDFAAADEIFTSGNASKVMPVLKFEERTLQPGPMARRARDLYWAFAHEHRLAA